MQKDRNRQERIVRLLGMSQGAASNKLRKNILFSFAQRLHEDICFKCEKRIETVEELSIEHKQPWENRSADLFWDLNNISFSHLVCNRQHTISKESLRKVGPEGTAWCCIHKEFLPAENFFKNSSNWNGIARQCKECHTRNDTRPNHAKI